MLKNNNPKDDDDVSEDGYDPGEGSDAELDDLRYDEKDFTGDVLGE